MTKKKPQGRPKLPYNKVKGRYFQVRISDTELARLRQAASVEGLSLSEWARQILLRRAKRVKLPAPPPPPSNYNPQTGEFD